MAPVDLTSVVNFLAGLGVRSLWDVFRTVLDISLVAYLFYKLFSLIRGTRAVPLINGVIILVVLWLSLGTSFLVFIAGLQGIDRSLYEAGATDGIRNRWQELWYITLPSMRPQLLFGAVLSITQSFAAAQHSIALAGFPSTDYAAHTVVTHLIDYGNIRFEMGYAASIATVLFLTMIGVQRLVQRLLRRIGSD